jgi:hypothetical protein
LNIATHVCRDPAGTIPRDTIGRRAAFDVWPFLTNGWPRLGYHTLTALLISFVTMYTWAALA